MLEAYIKEQRRKKTILLMTHIVLGYPDFKTSMAIVEEMVQAGVDLMELQIPFSEPIADGPVILKANQDALVQGVTVAQCMDFAAEVTRRFDIPFLFMTYYNILYQYGVDQFCRQMARNGVVGAIVPDLPPEEGSQYLHFMEVQKLAPIFIFAPTTAPRRMALLSEHGRGFVYCVARKGVTGQETDFSKQLSDYLRRCRSATQLPLAVGFGVKQKADVEYLAEHVDIAVIGSETIRLIDQEGISAVGPFIRSLR